MEDTLDESKKFCECGKCKVIISKRDPNGRKRRFARGHNASIRYGNLNAHWNGGTRTDKEGYRYVTSKGHHFADSNGYILEHRYVWEQANNATLLHWGFIHHINHIKYDNRLSNLQPMMNGDHSRMHNTKHED